MTLSHKHRTSIYRSLAPILGDEEADALMSQFPDRDDELVTKSFLRAELAELRTEVRTDIADLRTEMHSLLRQQLIWMVAAIFTAIPLAVSVSTLFT